MALMTCSECKKEVSDTAKTCPHCGAKVRKPMSRITMLAVGTLAFVMVFSMASPPAPAPAKTPEEIAEESANTNRYAMAKALAKTVRDAARDPDSLQFISMRVNDDASVLCSEYRARNGFGGMNKEFIVVTAKTSSQQPEAWNKHCTKVMHDMMWAAK